MLVPSFAGADDTQGLSAQLPAYAELMAVSNYSFLRGGSHPEELVDRAQALGYAAIAMTDECSLAGVVRAHVRAKQIGMPLLIGTQCRMSVEPSSTAESTNWLDLGESDRLLLL
ncbi:MAG: PHP domain-containing protein, partial [Betaproteobacteria bacterium]|nr:PHP domain-containing protein [Betaproteobacteria bacterium]